EAGRQRRAYVELSCAPCWAGFRDERATYQSDLVVPIRGIRVYKTRDLRPDGLLSACILVLRTNLRGRKDARIGRVLQLSSLEVQPAHVHGNCQYSEEDTHRRQNSDDG